MRPASANAVCGSRADSVSASPSREDAQVLVLDEGTSHVDAVNVQAVRFGLEELMS